MTETAASSRFSRDPRGGDRLFGYGSFAFYGRLPDYRCRPRDADGPVLAAEPRGGYDAASDPDRDPDPDPDRDPDTEPDTDPDSSGGDGAVDAPFGLPVLAELPELAGALQQLAAADRALLDAVTALAGLVEGGAVEHTTGVGVEHWLAAVAVQTRMDRRMLLRACRLLHRLPTLRDAVASYRVSFAQLRGLAVALRTAPKKLDGKLDELFGVLLDALERFEHPDPDVLVRQMADALDELHAEDLKAREDAAAECQSLFLQPYLDGTGGQAIAQLDAAGLALLDAVTTPTPQLVEAAGSYGAARVQLLLARLATNSGPSRPVHHEGDGADSDSDSADRDAADSGVPDESQVAAAYGVPVDEDGGIDWQAALPPAGVLLRVPFDALVDDTIPVDVLTRLTGGRLRLTAPAARRLTEATGTKLRTVVHDTDGTVLGVGRSRRDPPGWLKDVIASMHDTCTGPGCDRPARGRQIDHARPWWPPPDQLGGSTDLDNLGPLCASTNRTKEDAGWRVVQRATGTRTWTHARSGVVTTTIPSTWRPPDDPRPRWRWQTTEHTHHTTTPDGDDADGLPF